VQLLHGEELKETLPEDVVEESNATPETPMGTINDPTAFDILESDDEDMRIEEI
jgi:hypothetical protein